MDILNNSKPLKAVLVGVQLPRVSDEETQGSLAELSRLVTTLGYQVVGQTSQKRSSTKSATVLGDGKMKELASWTGGTGVVGPMVVKKKHKAALRFEKNQEEDDFEIEDDFEDVPEESEDLSLDSASEVPREKAQVVIFDCDLSPSQLRNLESATGAQVLDRTGVIIEIFSRHARTKAARLQVEIARLTYVAPRLRETAGGEDRGGGGIGGKGAGETSIELDRRKIRDRIKELKQELSAISQEHITRRSRRNQEISVALVGYTNAGKSSLMRALTGSEVLVADKLFATLDTTVRVLYPESRPKILISDTVGFIKKLPHDLVASFKSTLDEAANASLLLYVVDSSDPTFRSQLQVTKSVLDEVGASDLDSILVLNKVDRLSSEEREKLQQEYPDAIFLSAHNKEDVANLRLRLIKHFETAMIDEEILIPYDVQGAIGEIRAKMRVLSENYDNRGLTLTVRGHVQDIEKMRKKFGI
ncbi:GTPase HflX [Bdellovibrio bacteriovorus]|uniref:GTPase HflX n=1 Tax=Bdellovibrio bacteriovorus TaxID=959 RepID=A0A161PAH5_BDEBC|nr:GTPase HflX [Bdellovibrio bacteriovorus]KYG62914.1 GTPase HflX [Bdellovibrio bacteriovorus]